MQIILWSLRRSASGKRAMPFRKQGCNAKPSAGRALESQPGCREFTDGCRDADAEPGALGRMRASHQGSVLGGFPAEGRLRRRKRSRITARATAMTGIA